MKLKVFFATDGDCLLLTSADGHHALIDGGRAGSFREQTWGALRELAERQEDLDLVVVSHIDADHISGILWLMELVAEWTVLDFQVNEGANPGFRPPLVERPPTIKALWHNSWRAQLEDLAGPVEAFATRFAGARDLTSLAAPDLPPATIDLFDALDELGESIPQGVELRRLVDEDTPIPRNGSFKDLVLLRHPPHVEKLGQTKLTVIGPATKHLEALREEWRRWLTAADGDRAAPARTSGGAAGLSPVLGADELTSALATGRAQREDLIASLAQAATTIAAADPTKVTPPNRASITLLAEERRRTCLLTGDAAEEEILEGLEAAGRITDGRFSCNVLKVQHHGSEFNLGRTFAETVLADDYVLCGDGAHHNPDPSVVKTIIETRLAVDPRPMTLWFNCSPQRSAPSKRPAMEAAIAEARAGADAHPQVSVKVLDDDQAFLDITV